MVAEFWVLVRTSFRETCSTGKVIWRRRFYAVLEIYIHGVRLCNMPNMQALRMFYQDDKSKRLLETIASLLVRRKVTIVLGAGTEGQVYVPPAEMSVHEGGALLYLACS